VAVAPPALASTDFFVLKYLKGFPEGNVEGLVLIQSINIARVTMVQIQR
tara:strand:+ start:2290 stop:2436 length:147 start_codon:yes stop_codon:yes gene_type:complete